MTQMLLDNSINFVTLLAVATLLYTIVTWSRLPVLTRLVGLQFFFLALHINEESRLPGGFVVPALLFPRRTFLSMAPMVLGVFELVAHAGGIWIFDRPTPYTPGLATAACLLAPVGIYSIHYAVKNRLMKRADWLLVSLYMFFSVAIAQQIVVRSTGMPYLEFLNNVKKALLRR